MSELERLLLSAESDRASCQREALQATEVLVTMRSTNEEVSPVAGAGPGESYIEVYTLDMFPLYGVFPEMYITCKGISLCAAV